MVHSRKYIISRTYNTQRRILVEKEKIMDWPTFIGTVIVLLSAVIPMMVFPSASEKVITDINSAISNSIGSVYLFIGLAVLSFVLYIAFGRYGNVTLGKASDKPEFNNFSWAAMLFCAGIGSDILYWGVIEWAFYYQVPPNGAKGMTDEALCNAIWHVPLGTYCMGNLCITSFAYWLFSICKETTSI